MTIFKTTYWGLDLVMISILGKVMIIGGNIHIFEENKYYSMSSNFKNVLIFDPKDNSFTTGPSLLFGRSNGGCTTFLSPMHDNRSVVLSVGGLLQSTAELLDYTNPNSKTWEQSKCIYSGGQLRIIKALFMW